jgi:hypothetical protein
LINLARDELAGTGAAGACPAGIGEINALLFGGIEDVSVVWAWEGLTALKRDGERGHGDQKTVSQAWAPWIGMGCAEHYHLA